MIGEWNRVSQELSSSRRLEAIRKHKRSICLRCVHRKGTEGTWLPGLADWNGTETWVSPHPRRGRHSPYCYIVQRLYLAVAGVSLAGRSGSI
jgi:hypothetical protein